MRAPREDSMLNCAHLDNQHQKGARPARSSFARYAIYYTPQPGTALAAFGRSWFGRANDGATLQAFSDAGFAGSSFAKISLRCPAATPACMRSSARPSPCATASGSTIQDAAHQLRRTPQGGRDRSFDARRARAAFSCCAPSSPRPRSTGLPRNASMPSRTSLPSPTMRMATSTAISAPISGCCWRASAIPTS